MIPLQFSYDLDTDMLTVEGQDYAGDLFRQLACPSTWIPMRIALLPGGQCLLIQDKESPENGKKAVLPGRSTRRDS